MADEIKNAFDELARRYNRFFYDTFLSTERLIFTKTLTAIETKRLGELKLSTGVMANSTIKMRYDYNIFNIFYGEAIIRMQFSSAKNIFAFVGFKEYPEDPKSQMAENHSGIIVENEKLYFSTGNGKFQQKVEIVGIDITRDFVYKIKYNELHTCPLPQIIPYMDTFRIITPDRIWTMNQKNSTYPPSDTGYYFIVFLKNLTNEDKFINLKSFVYLQEYAD
jgi:hypothetical protein